MNESAERLSADKDDCRCRKLILFATVRGTRYYCEECGTVYRMPEEDTARFEVKSE